MASKLKETTSPKSLTTHAPKSKTTSHNQKKGAQKQSLNKSLKNKKLTTDIYNLGVVCMKVTKSTPKKAQKHQPLKIRVVLWKKEKTS